MNGLPLTILNIFLFNFCFCSVNIQKVTKPNIILFILILLIKGFFYFHFKLGMYVQDTYTHNKQILILNILNQCAKTSTFQLVNILQKVEQISFKVKNNNYEWLGANSSNFP